MSLISLKQISKIYKPNTPAQTNALSDVNLDIQPSEFVSISGPSGSGKTTLLNIIGALDSPSEGQIQFEGQDLVGLNEKTLSAIRLNKIGFVFQAYNLIPVFSAMENIEYVLMLQGVDEKERRQRVRALAKHLEIEQLLEKKPNEMSGGQQQRVAIARAIVSKPKLILADEPTANLDTKTGETIMTLLQRLNQEDKLTIIYTSHEPMVIAMAKRQIVLVDGKITEDSVH